MDGAASLEQHSFIIDVVSHRNNELMGLLFSFHLQGLHAVNLGDSGFIVVRDGCTIFRSPVQQHDFNYTYQLASCSDSDLPSAGEVSWFLFPVLSLKRSNDDVVLIKLFENHVLTFICKANYFFFLVCSSKCSHPYTPLPFFFFLVNHTLTISGRL